VQSLLERLRVDWVRCVEPESGFPLERPRDVLVTSGPRAMRMPPLAGDGEPLWVCIYDQNFLPLHERLRDLGIHYLVSGELAPRPLELFLRQLLHGGQERRQVRRVPLDCELELEVGFERRKGLLLELSRESCVFATDTEVPAERRTIVRLPSELTGDDELDLPGHVLRTMGTPGSVERGVTTVFRFDSLDAVSMARIHRILAGQAPAVPVTPLRSEPGHEAIARGTGWLEAEEAASRAAPAAPSERRSAPRSRYTRCVDAVRWGGEREPHVVFARDLSLSGMCITTSEPPDPGSEVAVALYGAAREEPVLLSGEVVRVDGEQVGLRFGALGDAERRGLGRLVCAAPRVEALAAGGALHVAELISS